MKKYIALGNILLFVGVVYVNYLGGSGQINGIGTGEVSGRFPTLFTPSGMTFAIWGLIYTLGAIFVVYQLYKAFRLPENFDRPLNNGFFFICVANAMWIVAWSRLAIGYSLFLMLVILIFLLGAYWKARSPKYTMEYIAEYLHFSIYLAWISVATIANVSIWLTSFGIEPYGNMQAIVTVLLLTVAVGLSLFFIFWQKNVWYPLVMVWAFYGIFIARTQDPSAGAEIVQMGAFGGLLVVFSAMAYFRIRQRRVKIDQ